jgi:hypothetical protein
MRSALLLSLFVVAACYRLDTVPVPAPQVIMPWSDDQLQEILKVDGEAIVQNGP